MESFSVKAILSAVDSGFSGVFAKAKNSVSQLEKGTGSGIKSVGKFGAAFGIASTIAGAGVRLIGSGLSSLVSGLEENSAAWSTFEGNMKFLGKTPKQIANVESSLKSYAQRTVYSASDMASAYSQFAATGVSGVGKLVKGMGGLAAATDHPQQAMKTLMQQGVQMAAKPMVQWGDFRLMLEQTPAGMAAVAKSMGMSLKDLIKNIQAGKVSSKDFFKAVSKAGNSKVFQGMATQFKTFGQAVDGLEEELQNKLAGAFGVVQGIGIKAISALINWIGQLNFDKVGASLQAMGAQFAPVVATIKSALSGLGNSGVLDGLKSAFSDIPLLVNTIISVIGKLAGGALAGLIKVATSVGKAFAQVFGGGNAMLINDLESAFTTFGQVAGAAIQGVTGILAGLPWVAIFSTVKTAMSAVGTVAKTVANILKSAFNNDIFKSLVVGIAGAVAAFKTLSGVASIVGTVAGVLSAFAGPARAVISVIKNFSTIVQIAGGIWKAFGLILGVNPFVLIVVAIAAVVAALVYFFTQTKTGKAVVSAVVKAIQSAWQGLATFLSGLWQGITSVASTVWDTVKGAWSAFVAWVKGLWSGIGAFFSGLWQGIVSVASAAWNGLTAVMSTIVAAIQAVWTAVGTFFTTLWTGIVTVAVAIWTTLTTAFSAIIAAIQAVWTTLTTFFATLWTGIVTAATTIWNMLVTVATTVFTALSTVISTILATIQAIWSAGWNLLVSVLTAIWSVITSVVSGAINAVSSVISSVLSAIEGVWSGIWNAIKSVASSVWNAIKSVVSSAINAVKSVITSVMNAIKSVVTSILNGIKSTFSSIWNAIKSVVSSVLNAIRSVISSGMNAAKSAVSSALNAIKSAFSAGWNAVKSVTSAGVQGVISAARAAIGGMASAGRAIMDSFLSGLQAAWGKVKSFVGGIASWIKAHKGPISYDRRLLIPAGNAIMQGLNSGLADEFRSVQRTVSAMASQISDSAAVSVPAIDSSNFSSSIRQMSNKINDNFVGAMQQELSASSKLTVEVPVNLDGTEIARVTADPMQKELDKRSTLKNLSYGRRM